MMTPRFTCPGSGRWVVLLTVAALIVASGCSLIRPSKPPPAATVEVAPPSPPEPRLERTADAQLTLFGEFPDRQRVPFHAQAASPMKQHTFTTEGADFDVDVSPDGQWVVFCSTRHTPRPNLYLKTIDGQAVTQLTDAPASDVQPCFSPDGQWVAFASNRSGNWDLWMVGLQGGQPVQLTNSSQHEVHPSFAPDGQRLAYCVFNSRGERWELWTLELNRTGSRRMIGAGLFPEWSPKGDSIVYQKARERGGRWFSIWRLDLAGGEPKFPVEVAASAEMALIQPSWSPDAEWITYGSAQVGAGGDLPESQNSTLDRGDIWIVRADGSSALQLTEGGSAHFGSVWSVDGRVYFTSLQNGRENIWSVRPLLTGRESFSAQSDDAAGGGQDARPPRGGLSAGAREPGTVEPASGVLARP